MLKAGLLTTIPFLLLAITSTAKSASTADQTLDGLLLRMRAAIPQEFDVQRVDLLSDTQQPTPIRHATMKIRISKAVAVIRRDGTFYFTSTPVCTSSVSINVYDARKPNSIPSTLADLKAYTCNTEFHGNKISLYAGSSLALLSRPLFGDASEEFKGIVPMIWTMPNLTGDRPAILSAFGGTRDLSSHASILINLQPDNLVTCTNGKANSCIPTNDEFFSATVEIMD